MEALAHSAEQSRGSLFSLGLGFFLFTGFGLFCLPSHRFQAPSVFLRLCLWNAVDFMGVFKGFFSSLLSGFVLVFLCSILSHFVFLLAVLEESTGLLFSRPGLAIFR